MKWKVSTGLLKNYNSVINKLSTHLRIKVCVRFTLLHH
jgi:hypothetical protein